MSGETQVRATIDRLRAVLDAYGAAPGRWPAAERTALQGLAAERAEARALVAEAAALDRALDEAGAFEPSPAALAGALALPDAAGRGALRLLWPFGPLWQPALPLAASLLLGLAVGLVDVGTEATEMAWNGSFEGLGTRVMEDWQ